MTSTRIPPVIESSRPNESEDGGADLPLGLLVGGILGTLGIGTYMVTYAASAAALERYNDGFVIDHCPTCEVGELELEERIYRTLGIPRIRRTVRCNNCRSVLREVGKRRWRYAVDPAANESRYRALNNRVLREEQLRNLRPADSLDRPRYIDDA